MLKLFLVEDESIIRKTLRDTVPWSQCGYSFVGEAGDGELASYSTEQARCSYYGYSDAFYGWSGTE